MEGDSLLKAEGKQGGKAPAVSTKPDINNCPQHSSEMISAGQEPTTCKNLNVALADGGVPSVSKNSSLPASSHFSSFTMVAVKNADANGWKKVPSKRKDSFEACSKTVKLVDEKDIKAISKSAKQRRQKKKNIKSRNGRLQGNAQTEDCSMAGSNRGDSEGMYSAFGEKDIKESGHAASGEQEKTGLSLTDPLSMDLYDRLRQEDDSDKGKKPWAHPASCEDLQKKCKKLSCGEKQFYIFLTSIFIAMVFAMIFGLLVLQSQMTMVSREIMMKMQATKKEIPSGRFHLYFDYLESDTPDRVDLRVNTTIFVH